MVGFDDCIRIGTIVKPIGTEEAFSVSLLHTHHLKELKMESVFVAINGNLIPFFISSLSFHKGNKAHIFFEDVTSPHIKEELIGKDLYLLQEQVALPEEPDEDYPLDLLVGFTVKQLQTENTTIGEVVAVDETAAHPILVISSQQQGEEILLPAIPEFVKKINREKSVIFITPPPGLLELYNA